MAETAQGALLPVGSEHSFAERTLVEPYLELARDVPRDLSPSSTRRKRLPVDPESEAPAGSQSLVVLKQIPNPALEDEAGSAHGRNPTGAQVVAADLRNDAARSHQPHTGARLPDFEKRSCESTTKR